MSTYSRNCLYYTQNTSLARFNKEAVGNWKYSDELFFDNGQLMI